jgi:hypothetical protein
MQNRRTNETRLKWIACTYNWTAASLANPMKAIHYAYAVRGLHFDV